MVKVILPVLKRELSDHGHYVNMVFPPDIAAIYSHITLEKENMDKYFILHLLLLACKYISNLFQKFQLEPEI